MKKYKKLVCSTINYLHDLSSNRCDPGWFLSFKIIIFSTIGIILFIFLIILIFGRLSVLNLEFSYSCLIF